MKKPLTLSQLEDIAENWYQRTHRLREVWQDSGTTKEHRDKAMRLFFVMAKRTLAVQSKIINMQQVTNRRLKFPSGGIVGKKEGERGYIMPRKK